VVSLRRQWLDEAALSDQVAKAWIRFRRRLRGRLRLRRPRCEGLIDRGHHEARIGVPGAVRDFLHAELVSRPFRYPDYPSHGASGAIRSVGVSKSVGSHELPDGGFQGPRPCGLWIAPRRLFHNGKWRADLEPKLLFRADMFSFGAPGPLAASWMIATISFKTPGPAAAAPGDACQPATGIARSFGPSATVNLIGGPYCLLYEFGYKPSVGSQTIDAGIRTPFGHLCCGSFPFTRYL
jgi:hypothetical protein